MEQVYYDFSLINEYLETLKKRLNIAIIYGGSKQNEESVAYVAHNTRPWKSYEAVAKDIMNTLQELGFEKLCILPDDMQLPQRLRERRIHMAWLNTGGVQGVNPLAHTPAMLEMLGIPYIGHDPLNSSILDNKHVFKHALCAMGIPTSPFFTWDSSRGVLKPDINSRFKRSFGDYEGPFVVKPVSGRASLEVHFVEHISGLQEAVTMVYEVTRNHVLIEKYLSGREYCVAVTGYVVAPGGNLKKHSRPFAFSEIERLLEKDERIFTSMDKRPISASLTRSLEQDDPLKIELVSLAQRVYWDFNLKTLVRLDLRADENGTIYVLEANPKPDLAKPRENITNLVTVGLKEHQMSYNDLILSLLCDRLDYLFTHQPHSVAHISNLLL